MKNPAAVELGKLGGSVKSEKKAKAVRENGKLGGRPGKKEHNWCFMGNDTKGRGDLAYCDLCDTWKWSDGKKFKMKGEKHGEMLASGEITGF